MVSASLDARLREDSASLLKLVTTLWDSGEVEKAAALLRSAHANTRAGAPIPLESQLFARGLPKYHFGMLADEKRNRAYQAAIARAAPQSQHVLDLGTGSGLLAMMAARGGAKRVTACESNPVLAWTASEIVAANGLSDRIDVAKMHSSQLDRELHLGGGADLIVTETFGHDLVGEAALSSISDAVERLAAPGARVIPARAAVMVALAAFDRTKLRPVVSEVCGFDLSLLDRHRPRKLRLGTDDPSLVLASEPAALFDFDLHKTKHPTSASVRLESLGQPVDGIVQWVRLDLDAQTRYENRPGPDQQSHWQAICWAFDHRTTLPRGESFEVSGVRTGDEIVVWCPTAGPTGTAPAG